MIILIYISWVLYASFSGMRDAYIYSGYIHKVNEHNVWFTERFFCGLTAIISFTTGMILGYVGLIPTILLGLSLCLSFPFFQLSTYYVTYNKLGKKDYNFFSKSTTTDARMNFDFPTRTSMFILSLFIILLITLIS